MNSIAATGSATFLTQPGLAYVAGSRVRVAAASAPANFVKGVATAYNSGTGAVTLAFDNSGNSPFFGAW